MPSIREVLESRYDQIDSGEDGSVEAVETAPEAPIAPAEEEPVPGVVDGGEEGDRQRDEQGRFVAEEDTKPEQARTPPPSRPGQGAVAGAAVTPPAAPAAPPAFPRAPQSWKPGIREKWTALPPDVQGEVVR